MATENQTTKNDEPRSASPEPTDEQMIASLAAARARVRVVIDDVDVAAPEPISGFRVARIPPADGQVFKTRDVLWRPPCVTCHEPIGYECKAGSYGPQTECARCRTESVEKRLAESGISFREMDAPLDALKNHDPDGKWYGGDYDRWLEFLRKFSRLEPRQRMFPPFAFASGSVGVGKSAGAERALRDAIRNGCDGRVITFRELVRRIMSTYGKSRDDVDERADDIVRTYAGIHLLVIQEIGLEDPTGHAYGLLFDFVDERWRHCRPTIFTSNYKPDPVSLGAVMTSRTGDDATQMMAILDRIRGGFGENIFVLRGQSWRGREPKL